MRSYSNQKTNTRRYVFLFLFLFLVWFCCFVVVFVLAFFSAICFIWLVDSGLGPSLLSFLLSYKAWVTVTVTVRPMYALTSYRRFLSCLCILKGFRFSQLVSNCTLRSRVWVTQVTAARRSVSEVYIECEEAQLLYYLLYKLWYCICSLFPVLKVDFHCRVIFIRLRQ